MIIVGNQPRVAAEHILYPAVYNITWPIMCDIDYYLKYLIL